MRFLEHPLCIKIEFVVSVVFKWSLLIKFNRYLSTDNILGRYEDILQWVAPIKSNFPAWQRRYTTFWPTPTCLNPCQSEQSESAAIAELLLAWVAAFFLPAEGPAQPCQLCDRKLQIKCHFFRSWWQRYYKLCCQFTKSCVSKWQQVIDTQILVLW